MKTWRDIEIEWSGLPGTPGYEQSQRERRGWKILRKLIAVAMIAAIVAGFAWLSEQGAAVSLLAGTARAANAPPSSPQVTP